MASDEYALITGGSSGIGEALAGLFAADGIALFLVASGGEQLKKVADQLRAEHNVAVETFAIDLTLPDATKKVYDYAHKNGIDVRYLVNNAGFGDRSSVVDAEPSRLAGMIRLNDEAPTLLSHYFSKDMIRAGRGSVTNIASIAAFIPGPNMATYYASKAYLLSFSLALSEELRPHGISVTAVCPGPTRSNFASAARASSSRIFSGNLPTSLQVATFAYKALQSEKLVATWGVRNRLLSRIATLLPRKKLLRMVNRVQ